MNIKHATIQQNLAAATRFNLNLQIPWPSIMTVRQISYYQDGTQGVYGIWSEFLTDDHILGSFVDGPAVTPQSKFIIPQALNATFNTEIRLLNTFLNPGILTGNLYVHLEFEKYDSSEEKKSK